MSTPTAAYQAIKTFRQKALLPLQAANSRESLFKSFCAEVRKTKPGIAADDLGLLRRRLPLQYLQKYAEPVSNTPAVANPFLPTKGPSGKWRAPRYPLRIQKELIKKAIASNTVHLLPPGPKMSAEKLEELAKKLGPPRDLAKESWAKPVVWIDPKAKARAEKEAQAQAEEVQVQLPQEETEASKKKVALEEKKRTALIKMYAGRKRAFKGHQWERTLEARMARRKALMRTMAKRIDRYRTYYKSKRPNPLWLPRNTGKAPKLPF